MSTHKSPARDPARRQRILEIALDAFLEHGYAATSMSAIAARLGGSKGTLYAYVESKEALFIACLEAFAEEHARRTFRSLDEGGAPELVLTEFCRSFLAAILSKRDLALHRLVIAEAERFPSIGKAFYASGPETGLRRLSRYIAQCMAERKLRAGDADEASRLLLSLCQSGIYQARLFNVIRRPASARVQAHAASCVATFLTAFGPAGGIGSGG